MGHQVNFHIRSVGERFVANLAGVRFGARVNSLVALQVAQLRERLGAAGKLASVAPSFLVIVQVNLQRGTVLEILEAVFTELRKNHRNSLFRYFMITP